MRREVKQKKAITPEQLRQIRLANGEIKFVEERDPKVWTKTKKEKLRLKDARADHNALLKSQGLNPKKYVNDGNLIFMK